MISSSGHRGKRFAGTIEYRAVSERFRNPASMPDLPAAGDAPPRDENGLPDLVAAVDLGSNSFHMKIARVVGGNCRSWTGCARWCVSRPDSMRPTA